MPTPPLPPSLPPPVPDENWPSLRSQWQRAEPVEEVEEVEEIDDDPSEDDASMIEKAAEAIAQSRKTPSWLISTIVHIALFLILAAFQFQNEIREGIMLNASFDGGGQDGTEFEIGVVGQTAPDISGVDVSTVEVSKPTDLDAIPEMDIGSTVKMEEVAVKRGFAGRSGALKGALLKAFGGTGDTEDAVSLGLKWLKRNQQLKGNWSMKMPYKDGATNEDTPAATAMALLAFMGAGNTHVTGEYADVVNKGIQFLISQQREDGFLATASPGRQKMYAHAQATIAVCELYGLTRDSKLLEPAQKAVKFAIEAQSTKGGWRYEPREDQDLSVTGWYVMALMSARMAGISVDSDVFFKIGKFLDSVQKEGGALYTYQDFDVHPSVSMTAEGLLSREYLGWERDNPKLLQGSQALLDRKITWKDPQKSVYYWYYATQVLHHLGGDPWQEWNEVMRVELPANQVKSGNLAGSWDPSGDAFAAPGGRLYVTCLCLYCLEVYYRHMPLYGLQKSE
ncbi:MAG: hypothetical protein RLY14_3434 [Planctomycetota bacterium]|jgi:hypothetical protein